MSDLVVTGLCPYRLLRALYEGSRPKSELCLRIAMQAPSTVTVEDVKAEVEATMMPTNDPNVPRYPDYLWGRPIKAALRREGDEVILSRTDLYDRDIGEGAAARIVDALRVAS